MPPPLLRLPTQELPRPNELPVTKLLGAQLHILQTVPLPRLQTKNQRQTGPLALGYGIPKVYCSVSIQIYKGF